MLPQCLQQEDCYLGLHLTLRMLLNDSDVFTISPLICAADEE